MISSQSYFGFYPQAELVLGITSPLGTEYRPVLDTLKNHLEQFRYTYNEIHLSEEFPDLLIQVGSDLTQNKGADAASTIKYKIDAGNEIRQRTQNDVFALVAASRIASSRQGIDEAAPSPLPLQAHIIVSLKHPREVEALRRIYGNGFFLIGLVAPEGKRLEYLNERGIKDSSVRAELIDIDAKETFDFGQQTRDTFHLSDVFISLDQFKTQIPRFLDLIFGSPFETPTNEEHAMFQAYAASLRSGDLSRQVGAALISDHGDLLSIGCNEVPKFGGGQYGPQKQAQRDMERGVDSNEMEKLRMAEAIVEQMRPEIEPPDRAAFAKKVLKSTGFFDITEFGRTVHAEMEAILACGRNERSAKGATLYTTTFPCHNCTRHAIGAGVRKVIYIEPYARARHFLCMRMLFRPTRPVRNVCPLSRSSE